METITAKEARALTERAKITSHPQYVELVEKIKRAATNGCDATVFYDSVDLLVLERFVLDGFKVVEKEQDGIYGTIYWDV